MFSLTITPDFSSLLTTAASSELVAVRGKGPRFACSIMRTMHQAHPPSIRDAYAHLRRKVRCSST
ncbi:hypothetical protein LB503_000813 [Fusarium chuoi]|nr:hypothetical protein LB503_000813 [Fusarium chuoi]